MALHGHRLYVEGRPPGNMTGEGKSKGGVWHVAKAD
jgi:hypothetical protein